jgi:SAM-dependent methyltransferase
MRCPVCAAEVSTPPMETHGRYTLRRCAVCDVQFADPMQEAPADFYDSGPLYGGPESLHASPRLLDWDQRCFLRDRPCPGGLLLDVGCGTGRFVEAARQAGYRARGLDLSAAQVEVARRRFRGIEVHAGRLHDYARQAAPGSFDIVTAFQVLEHVADPPGFLRDLHRLLRAGGHLALGVPTWRAWRAFRDPDDAPPNHLTRWSRPSLTRALDDGGFTLLTLREHRSAYNVLLRRLRLGLVRRLMRRSARAGGEGRIADTAVALSIAKVRALTILDALLRPGLFVVRAPGVTLYALARARE